MSFPETDSFASNMRRTRDSISAVSSGHPSASAAAGTVVANTRLFLRRMFPAHCAIPALWPALAHEPAAAQPRLGPVQRTGREAVRLGVGAEPLVLLAQSAKMVQSELVARALRARNGCLGQRLCHGQPLHRSMNRRP